MRSDIKICNWKGGKKAAVSLVFDDGYRETYETAVPLLNKYGFRATFALALDRLGKDIDGIECATLEEWERIRNDYGHELSSHGMNHLLLTKLPDDELDSELRVSKEKLQAMTLIYPGGRYDTRVKEYAKRHYLAGRGAEEGLNSLSPPDMFELKSVALMTDKPSLFRLNLKAKYAQIRQMWLIEMYHLVSAKSYDYNFCTRPELLEAHLRYLKKSDVWVDTLANVCKYIKERNNSEAMSLGNGC